MTIGIRASFDCIQVSGIMQYLRGMRNVARMSSIVIVIIFDNVRFFFMLIIAAWHRFLCKFISK